MEGYKYELFVGSTADGQMVLSVDEIMRRLSAYYEEIHLDFSMHEQTGGYLQSDGGYVVEQGVHVILYGNYSEEQIEEEISELRDLLKQESIMICRSRTETRFN